MIFFLHSNRTHWCGQTKYKIWSRPIESWWFSKKNSIKRIFIYSFTFCWSNEGKNMRQGLFSVPFNMNLVKNSFSLYFSFWNIRFDSNFSAETIEYWCRILDPKKRTHTTNKILLCSVCMKTDWQLDIVANFFCLSTICRATFNYCANVNNGNRAEFSKPQTPIDILDNNNCSKIHFMIHESHRFAIIQAKIY